MTESWSAETALRTLLDRASITDLIYDFGRCIDDGDAAGYAANFTDDALLILPFAEVRGRDNILAMPGPPPGWATHHHLSNVTVQISGDRATSRAYVIATHVFDVERPSVKAQAGGLVPPRAAALRGPLALRTREAGGRVGERPADDPP